MSIYGILCGYTDFENMADFLEVHEEYFTQLLGLKNGPPSHDTLSRSFFNWLKKNSWTFSFHG